MQVGFRPPQRYKMAVMFNQAILAVVFSGFLTLSQPGCSYPREQKDRRKSFAGLYMPAAITAIVEPGYPLQPRFVYIRVENAVYPLFVKFG